MRHTYIVVLFFSSLITRGQEYPSANGQLPSLNRVKEELGRTVAFHDAQAYYSWISDGTTFNSNQSSVYGDFLISSQWSVASVPFELQINNQTWQDIAVDNFSTASLHFDRDIYLDQLRSRMKKSLNAGNLLKKIKNDPVTELKRSAEDLFKKDIDELNQQYGGQLTSEIEKLGSFDDLLHSDMVSIRQELLSSNTIKSIETQNHLLTELTNRENTGRSVNSNDLKKLEEHASKGAAVKALFDRVQKHKNKWQSSGLMRMMKNAELLNKKQLEEIIKNPDAIARFAKQHFNLSGFQKFFLKADKLNIGRNTLSKGKLSVQHLINNGINSDFLNNNRYLMIGVGKLKTLNSILDQSYSNALQISDGMMKMGSIGLGKSNSSNSRVSMMSFDQSMDQFGNMAMRSMRTALVTTFSNDMQIGSNGILSTEISRSATNYDNVVTSDTTLDKKSSFSRIMDADNFWKNTAFSLRYEDELEEQDLSYGIRIGKTANGYVNPGSPLLASGAKNVGFNIRKSFFTRRLQASVRSEMREYDYSEDHSKIWRNYYSVLDIKLKLKKGHFLEIRYLPNKMLRIANGIKSNASSLSRLSIDGNFSSKIGGVYYRNNISLSRQTNSYLLTGGEVSSNSFSVSAFQNFVVNRKLLYVNFNYEHVNSESDFIYLSSSLILEAGTTYMLFNRLSLSSALSYNEIARWYKQIGIKQTVAGQLGERFSLNAYLDIRKSIKIEQPLFYSPIRADISLHYTLRK